MNKKIILIVIAVVLVIIGIVAVVINNENSQEQLDNQYTNISVDTFVGTVIAIDLYQVTIIPNEDELIRQSSFEIINAVLTENTKVYNKEVEDEVGNISVGDSVKVTFDGKIYEVKPGKIIAQRIDLMKKANIEE